MIDMVENTKSAGNKTSNFPPCIVVLNKMWFTAGVVRQKANLQHEHLGIILCEFE